MMIFDMQFRARTVLYSGQSFIGWLPAGEYTKDGIERVPSGRDRPGETAEAYRLINASTGEAWFVGVDYFDSNPHDCDTHEPFTLQPPPRERKPLTVAPPIATRQGKLFAGADCLPGQLDLIPSDGPRAR